MEVDASAPKVFFFFFRNERLTTIFIYDNILHIKYCNLIFNMEK
jgi:hypothetical protein